MDDEQIGGDTDPEIAEAMRATDPGRLSDDFHDSLWNDIASELRRPAAPAARSRIATHTVRRLGAVAAVVALSASLVVALVVRHADHADQISSPPSTSPHTADDPGSSSPGMPSITIGPTPQTTTLETTTPKTTTLETTTASNTAGVVTSTMAPLAASTTTVPVTTTTDPSTITASPPVPAATDVRVAGPLPAIPGSIIASASMIDATTGWVVTNAVIAHTSDAGVTWRTKPLPPMFDRNGSYNPGRDVELDADHAWVARAALSGNHVTITRTADGAQTTATSTIDPGFPLGVPIGLVFIDALNGFVSIANPAVHAPVETGQGTLFRTSDGGATFQRVAELAPVPLAFDTSTTGWGGGTGLFRTTDGAATWTRLTPPGFDDLGADPNGPNYTIITTTSQRTVIKLYAPRGLGASVSYLATDDQGATWTPVGPPDTGEVNNTGPQSTLTALSSTQWFGIQQTLGTTATLWQSIDGGRNYEGRPLPFDALTITMGSPSTGWITTADKIRVTRDGGASWTTTADVIAPATLSNGCVWQPSLSGSQAAGQHQYILITLTNTGPAACPPPTVSDVNADPGGSSTTVHATKGPTLFPLPALPSIVQPGAAVALQIEVLDPLEPCGNPPSRFINAVTVVIHNAAATLVPLPVPIQTACSFEFIVGGNR